VEYQVRTARITDVERIVALLGTPDVASGAGISMPGGSADLLRQLVGLPHAVVMVAEANRRILGAGVLAIRPSVQRGGFIGTIDVLSAGSGAPPDTRTTLAVELMRAARNKGCVVVEAEPPADPAERARWAEAGFVESGPRIVRSLAPVGAGRT
jgi:hypothetical protein